jgi:AraC-like DNA-binding protein
MATEQVRMWRPPGEDRVLLMAGRTTRYAVEPRGEYIVGVVANRPMRSRRGRERRLVCPGQLVVWDPFNPHSGTAVDDRPWWSRLMVIEIGALATFAGDREPTLLDGVAFPEPVVSDAELVRGFLRLHAALEAPMTRLERDERLAGWLRALIERSSAIRLPRLPLSPRNDRALRRACEYLADRPERNVGLDELADNAGIDKFSLVHLFRERIGLPPHALQIAHRVHNARRLLEAGQTVAATATATGFADQSHLHRHFQRTLGLTPGEYQQRFAETSRSRHTSAARSWPS